MLAVVKAQPRIERRKEAMSVMTSLLSRFSTQMLYILRTASMIISLNSLDIVPSLTSDNVWALVTTSERGGALSYASIMAA